MKLRTDTGIGPKMALLADAESSLNSEQRSMFAHIVLGYLLHHVHTDLLHEATRFANSQLGNVPVPAGVTLAGSRRIMR